MTTLKNEMPNEIWAVPYEDMGNGAWDECAWEPCTLVENQKRPKYETPYIRRAVSKEEAEEVLAWLETQPNAPKHYTKEGNTNCREIIRKLLEAHK